jgi:ABC-type lipoprotein release transport system permease subunit
MAVVLAIAIRSIQRGAYGNMINNAVRFSTGYIQVHARGYWGDQSLNNSFIPDKELEQTLKQENNISLSIHRLESFALASSGQYTKGVAVMGINPAEEDSMNHLKGKLVSGNYLKNEAGQGILIGDGLANYLRLQLNDTIVLLGQGFHGSTAAGQYRVQGIFHYPIQEPNNSMVFLSLPDAQTLFSAQDRLTSISLMLHNTNDVDGTAKSLEKSVDSNWEVMQWPAMNKNLVQEIQGDNAGGIIMLAILYLVVAFGVFGTILMMTLERKKEFAVMVAIGMQRSWLGLLIMLETVFIGILGILSGIAIIFPFLVYLHKHPIVLSGKAAESYQKFGIEPIIPASLHPTIFLYQGLTVLGIAIISVAYPLWHIGRFKLAETLKQ